MITKQQVKWSLVGRLLFGCFLLVLTAAGCDERSSGQQVGTHSTRSDQGVLRLAITTSTHDSGLMAVLVPVFESRHAGRVDLIAAGTGKAIKLGENGDVDVLLVHAREAEEAFMKAGHGSRREPVMYNTFELLGPGADPAGIKRLSAAAALRRIAAGRHPFVSRGDDSGTHQREMGLWRQGGDRPLWDAYIESGQGMGATLIMADQRQAYVLSDRGTYLAFKDKIELVPLGSSGEELFNPYGIMTVNPEKNDRINDELATAFVDFMISPEAQTMIRDFRVGEEPLFYPLRLADRN